MSTGSEWLKCPSCGSYVAIKRIGKVGVPESAYGKRRDTKDSNRFICEACTERFSSDGVTWREYYGYTPDEDVPL
jgi:hypothetical protein